MGSHLFSATYRFAEDAQARRNYRWDVNITELEGGSGRKEINIYTAISASVQRRFLALIQRGPGSQGIHVIDPADNLSVLNRDHRDKSIVIRLPA